VTLLLLGKAAVLAHPYERPLAAELDDQREPRSSPSVRSPLDRCGSKRASHQTPACGKRATVGRPFGSRSALESKSQQPVAVAIGRGKVPAQERLVCLEQPRSRTIGLTATCMA